jgi:signal transduction histidine kinase
MSETFWDEAVIAIFFFYGLAFYSMGLALIVESGRASELGFARSMRLLAGFGLLHGTHEWIDMFERGAVDYYDSTLPTGLLWFQLALLITSFLALLAFGEHLSIRERFGRNPRWHMTIGAFIVYAVSCVAVRFVYDLDEVAWRTAADVLARYLIGIPGALIACWALWQQRGIFRDRGMASFGRGFTVAAWALAGYGLVGQIFTAETLVFPSNCINAQLFHELTGFPVQLFRAAMATIVAVAMIRVLRGLEVEREQRMEAIERDKVETEHRSREELTRLNAELRAANRETERLLREVRRSDTLRGELLQQITAAQEAERKRIARELHDGTGQMLTGLGLGLRGLSKRATEHDQPMASQLSDLETMAVTALGELRNLINDLRPPQLDDMGLAAALRFMVTQFNSRENAPEVDLEVHGEPLPFPSEVETTLFRIAQEGLTNVIKHAQASHVWVILNYTSSGASLRVRDDGVGFDSKAIFDSGSPRRAWGLIGVQERVNLIDADVFLDSTPGKGTTLTVCLERAVLKDEKNVDKSIDH